MFGKHLIFSVLLMIGLLLSQSAGAVTISTSPPPYASDQDWRPDEVLIIDGATVTFNANVDAWAARMNAMGGNIVLNSASTIQVDTDFNVKGYGSDNGSLSLVAGSTVIAGDSISFETEAGTATVNVTVASGSTSYLQALNSIHVTRNATLQINANGILDAKSKIFVLGEYAYVMPGDESWFPFPAPTTPEPSGGVLSLGNNATLKISDIGYFGEGGTTNASSGSLIEIGGVLYVLGGTHNFFDVKAGYSADPVPFRGAKIYGGTINFNADVDINGSSQFQGLLDATLADNQTYETKGDFLLMGSSSGSNIGKATFRMGENSHIKTLLSGTATGIIISSGGGTGESELIIVAGNTPQYAELWADYVLVTERGKITVESNSELFFNVNPSSVLHVPTVIIGKYEPSVLDFSVPLDNLPSGRGNSTGGTLDVKSNSTVNVGSTMYVGQGAQIDMASGSTLYIGGALYITGGTMNFANLDVGAAAIPPAVGGISVRGGTINFNDTVSVTGNMYFGKGPTNVNINANVSATGVITLEDATTVTMAQSTAMTTDVDLMMASYGATSPTITLGNNSTINAGVSQHGGINIGDSDSGIVDNSKIIIANNATATFNAGQYVHAIGQLIVGDNSTLNININDTSASPYGEGAVIVGWYKGEFSDLLDPNGGQPYPDENPHNNNHAAGLLQIRDGAQVTTNHRFLLGDTGTLDISPTGNLDVNGDFYWSKNGVYKVGITSTDAGMVDVNGTAHIEDGAIVQLNSHLTSVAGTAIFRANSYDSATLPTSALYKITRSGDYLVVDSVNSQDTIAVIAGAGGQVGVSENYANAGTLINQILVSPDSSPELIDALNDFFTAVLVLAEEGNPAADTALKQVIGEEAILSINIATDTINNINGALGIRFDAIHTNRLWGAPSAGNLDNLNRLWVSGFGSFVRQKNVNGMYGYDYDVGGVIVGYDRDIDSAPGLTMGLNLSLSSGKLKNNDGLSEIKVKTLGIGAYASYDFPNSLYLDASLGLGFSDNDFSSEQLVGGRKSASFDGKSFQAGLELGYINSLTDNLYLIPSVGLSYSHIKQKGWTENIDYNPSDLVLANWFSDSSVDYTEAPVRLKLQGDFQTAGGAVVSPELYVGGTFVLDKPDREMRVGFVGSDKSMTIRGIDSGKHRFVTGLGAKVQLTDSFDVFGNYNLETRNSYASHSGQLGLGVSF